MGFLFACLIALLTGLAIGVGVGIALFGSKTSPAELERLKSEVNSRDDFIDHVRETTWQHREIESSSTNDIVLDDIRNFQRAPEKWVRPQ